MIENRGEAECDVSIFRRLTQPPSSSLQHVSLEPGDGDCGGASRAVSTAGPCLAISLSAERCTAGLSPQQAVRVARLKVMSTLKAEEPQIGPGQPMQTQDFAQWLRMEETAASWCSERRRERFLRGEALRGRQNLLEVPGVDGATHPNAFLRITVAGLAKQMQVQVAHRETQNCCQRLLHWCALCLLIVAVIDPSQHIKPSKCRDCLDPVPNGSFNVGSEPGKQRRRLLGGRRAVMWPVSGATDGSLLERMGSRDVADGKAGHNYSRGDALGGREAALSQ